MPDFDGSAKVTVPETGVFPDRLIWDVPNTEGKQNVLRRAERLVNLQWRPLRKIAQNTINGLFCLPDRAPMEGEIRVGAPYSSSRYTDRFIGRNNVPLSGFRYAVNNPFSDYYSRYLQDFYEPYFSNGKRYSLLFYGCVCSTFCDYALNLPFTYLTHEWDHAPELFCIERQDVQALELCDTLVTVNKRGLIGGHVRMVTGIGRDETGKIREVEISEGTEPHAVTIHHRASELAAQLVSGGGNYYIYRYRTVDETEDPEDAPLPACPEVLMSMIPGSLIGAEDPVCFAVAVPDGTLVVESGEHTFTADVASLPAERFQGKAYRLWRHEPLPTGEYRVYVRHGNASCEKGEFTVANLPLIVPEKNSKPLPMRAFYLCTEEGERITKDSECLYENGELRSFAKIAVTDGTRILPQRIEIRRDGDDILCRTATHFLNEDGTAVKIMKLEIGRPLYMYVATEGDTVDVPFPVPDFCTKAVCIWASDNATWFLHERIPDAGLKAGLVQTVVPPARKDISHIGVHLYKGQYSLPLWPVAVLRETPESSG